MYVVDVLLVQLGWVMINITCEYVVWCSMLPCSCDASAVSGGVAADVVTELPCSCDASAVCGGVAADVVTEPILCNHMTLGHS